MGNVDWQDPVLGNWGFGAFTILLIADLGSNQPTQTSSAINGHSRFPITDLQIGNNRYSLDKTFMSI